jgi:hypothetical protein
MLRTHDGRPHDCEWNPEPVRQRKSPLERAMILIMAFTKTLVTSTV